MALRIVWIPSGLIYAAFFCSAFTFAHLAL
jgi:hypothetical protein